MKILASKRCRSLVLILSLLLAALAHQTFAQQPLAPEPPAPASAVQSDLAKRKESFQIVWQTVNELFYDPKFGGVNWVAVRERYEPLVAKSGSDREFHSLLQQMLNELHQSHFLVIPRDAIPKIRSGTDPDHSTGGTADDDSETDEDLDSVNYKIADRLLTGIGIDLRVLEGSAVVTRVEPGSTAARAGLRPGFVIKRVGDRSLDQVIAEIERHPLWGSMIRPELPVFLVAGFINGDQTAPLRLAYLDARNRMRSISIRRERLKGEMSAAIGNLPSLYTEFEARRLPGGLGYIRFNAFVPSLMEKFCNALRTMKDAPGLILDLRGNQGGLLGMVGGLSGLLESTPTSMGSMQTRTGRIPLYVFPQTSPYSGPLVLLLDGSTQSAGEMFASGLQESGRAILIGERSAGNTLPSAIKKLPTGALFQYGFANFETPSGKPLEGAGVNPDLTVALSRGKLLRSGDPQLNAAIRRLRQEILEAARPIELITKIEDVATASPPAVVAAPASKSLTEARVGGPIRVVIGQPPPPRSGPVVNLSTPVVSDLPSLDSILQKYLEASGGKSAFDKLTSRVSRGTVEITALGITGTAEIDEQSPNRSSLIIEAPGLGKIQRTFDGSHAWLQDPLQGFIRFTGPGLELSRTAAAFNKQARMKELYPAAVVIGKEKLAGKTTYVVEMGFEKWFFDAESGLLLRKGNTYYDDYREVDGVKLPFRMRDDLFAGAGLIYQLTEIKHNVEIDESRFSAYPSCFTKR